MVHQWPVPDERIPAPLKTALAGGHVGVKAGARCPQHLPLDGPCKLALRPVAPELAAGPPAQGLVEHCCSGFHAACGDKPVPPLLASECGPQGPARAWGSPFGVVSVTCASRNASFLQSSLPALCVPLAPTDVGAASFQARVWSGEGHWAFSGPFYTLVIWSLIESGQRCLGADGIKRQLLLGLWDRQVEDLAYPLSIALVAGTVSPVHPAGLRSRICGAFPISPHYVCNTQPTFYSFLKSAEPGYSLVQGKTFSRLMRVQLTAGPYSVCSGKSLRCLLAVWAPVDTAWASLLAAHTLYACSGFQLPLLNLNLSSYLLGNLLILRRRGLSFGSVLFSVPVCAVIVINCK